MPILILNIVLMAFAVFGIINAGIRIASGGADRIDTVLLVVCIVYLAAPSWMLLIGLKVLRPNEAYVLTLFGKYYGSLKGPGFFFVNPFTMAVNPLKQNQWEVLALAGTGNAKTKKSDSGKSESGQYSSKISLKTLTLNNNKQKINDLLGNPIEIGIVVIWRVVNTAKAVFNVENYEEYLSTQSDSALRNIVRLYPYDIPGEEGETSLRASAAEISEKILEEIQAKADIAGLEIIDARITHLAYAPEIAAAMLQRQQASAIIDARAAIVNGAVGMVEQALAQLNEKEIVHLDEERKAAMVSNLLVVLCGNRDAQPIINSGTLY
jgi:regulator of protease activity HflC (stomatin/prohibitin superfamily)